MAHTIRDRFFANFSRAKELVKKHQLRPWNQRLENADPRSVKRIQDELEAAREHARLRSVNFRNRIS